METKNEFLPTKSTQSPPSNLVHAEAEKAVAEVQASYVMAIKKPRDQMAAVERIKTACARQGVAENAIYSYPRGGQRVTGPSIRLAEVIAQNWGNVRCGVQELSRNPLETTMRAYCIDLETNFADEKTFTIEHIRDKTNRRTNENERIELETQRDIYENNANFAARRKRACILAVIPPDIIDIAMQACNKTLSGNGTAPLEDRIRLMVEVFGKYGIKKEHIEKRLKHKVEAIDNAELNSLRQIMTSLKDGASKREDWFDLGPSESDLNAKFATTNEGGLADRE